MRGLGFALIWEVIDLITLDITRSHNPSSTTTACKHLTFYLPMSLTDKLRALKLSESASHLRDSTTKKRLPIMTPHHIWQTLK
jgi:hypothetical protein